jgi:arylsulfatase
MIYTDQHRCDGLSCYGNGLLQTPNLDRIAAGGVLCENAFVANCVCSPSRASVATGRYPSAHGLKSNGLQLPADELTFQEILRQQGYGTASVGKIHLAGVNSPLEENSPESAAFWQAGRTFPSPCYGFETVRLANHSHRADGHYGEYLQAAGPRLSELLTQERALARPTGAPSSWQSAIPEEHHCSTWIADESLSLLEDYAQGSKPFCMQVSFPDPHFPYCPPAPYCHQYDPADVPMPRRTVAEISGSPHLRFRMERLSKSLGFPVTDITESQVREIIAHTYGMISLVDRNVGRILDRLEELGLADNTLVVFLADHGEHLGDHWLIYKCSEYDELIRVPLLWRLPGRFDAGRRLQGLVSHIDIAPTILDTLGVEIPLAMQGQSYTQALCGKDWDGREWIMVEGDDTRSNSFSRTLRTPRYRFTRYPDRGEGELYDLQEDPNEFRYVYEDPAYEAVKNELTLQLLDASLQSLDPLPTGEAPF